ncbi:MAG TPA: HAMP domain-containing sensor histidine kinase [Longimicrobiales bacterium]|nr:HAMP domain-containing sensor histidine kinase [Longimicrobiales bacterium]
MNTRHWPVVLALLAIAVLGSYLLYTEQLVREFRIESEVHKRMYAIVQQGLLSTEPGAELEALTDLQTELTHLGVPMVVLNSEGVPYAVENLPFDANLSEPLDRARVLAFAAELDRRNPPIVESRLGSIHFGSPPVIGRLRWAATLQVGGAILLLFVGFVVVRGALRAERERLWSAMARELAHQMGTPLTSLKGWHEVLRLAPEERARMASDARIAREVGADIDRLERVSRRFELIGKPPGLAPVKAEAVLRELEAYLRPRLPKAGPAVVLMVRVAPRLPALEANQVLLVWALENLVKNALDALAGRGGRIRLAATRGPGAVRFVVADDGPGIDPEIRDTLFEPGVTTKPGGWGVGLSLARRIIEDVHDGKLRSGNRAAGGARFDVRIPVAGPRRKLGKRRDRREG